MYNSSTKYLLIKVISCNFEFYLILKGMTNILLLRCHLKNVLKVVFALKLITTDEEGRAELHSSWLVYLNYRWLFLFVCQTDGRIISKNVSLEMILLVF